MIGWAGFSGELYAGGRKKRRSRIRDRRIHDRRILYVDDELLMRLAVARLLRGAGAVCVGSSTHD
jgi:CheY-like chemotaxis protein